MVEDNNIGKFSRPDIVLSAILQEIYFMNQCCYRQSQAINTKQLVRLHLPLSCFPIQSYLI